MIKTRLFKIAKKLYAIKISDDRQALQAAIHAGRAVVGLINPDFPCQFLPCRYVAEARAAEEIPKQYLERVIRRHLRLPWKIAETKRLVIREWCNDDFYNDIENGTGFDCCNVFESEELMDAYIKNQYQFYEFGMWALIEKVSNSVIGTAGIENGGRWHGEPCFELGYHVHQKWRKKGFAREACQAIIKYAVYELELPVLYARIHTDNTASIRLAESLGFTLETGIVKSGQKFPGVAYWKRCLTEEAPK